MFLIDTPGWLDNWETYAKYTLVILGIYFAVLWLTLIFWAYRDIRLRSRDPIVQAAATLLVLFFFLPGHWVYLILRPRYTLVEVYERSLEEEALLQDLDDQKACPTCRRRVQDDFLICPSCRTQLKETCRSCAKPLNYAWLACPYCGLEKAPRESYGPRPARSGVRNAPKAAEAAARPAAPMPPRSRTEPPRQAAEARTTVSAAPPVVRRTPPALDPAPPAVNERNGPAPRPSTAATQAAPPAAAPAAEPATRDPFAPRPIRPGSDEGPVIGVKAE